MGVIRVLLAIAVVLVHVGGVWGYQMIDGVIAVQAFYIISGFYMSLIINEKYNQKKSYGLFISNRLLRIFPTYFLIAIITILVITILNNTGNKQEFFTKFPDLSFGSKAFILFVNTFIIGQDVAMFVGLDASGSIHFVRHYLLSTPPVFTLLICPAAWSLGVELMFYLVAPFLVKRKIQVILFLMFLSLVLRLIIYKTGHYYDPWTYRFFPTELLFFLLGNISYRIYKRLIGYKRTPKIGMYSMFGFILCIILFRYIPGSYEIKQYLFYVLFTFFVAAIFIYTKNNPVDRFIGELSYPIYLFHISIILYFIPLFGLKFSNGSLKSLAALLLTIIFSTILVQYLIRPIDNYRNKRILLISKA
jgi:peptidoglycan/LPS O-acetylase OafA/YrhL